jgi:preprotein translocase subunit YajC
MGTQTSVPPKGSNAAQPAPAANPLLNFMPMIVIFGIFYMLLIRPQKKQENERKKMIEALKVGDRIMTQGGVYGNVTAIRGDVIQIRLVDGKMEIHRTAIGQVVKETVNGAQTVTSGERA